MLLDDISKYIDASTSISLTEGVNLFKSFMPSAPNTAVGLYEVGGLSPEWGFGGAAPIRERPRLQIIVRSTSYPTARSLAESIHVRLDRQIVNSTSVSSTGPRYLLVSAVHQPAPIGMDADNRHQISTNYDIEKERS